VSLPALMEGEYDGWDLRLGCVLARTDAYVRRAVTYRSGDLRISGIMNLPRGSGPWAAVAALGGARSPSSTGTCAPASTTTSPQVTTFTWSLGASRGVHTCGSTG